MPSRRTSAATSRAPRRGYREALARASGHPMATHFLGVVALPARPRRRSAAAAARRRRGRSRRSRSSTTTSASRSRRRTAPRRRSREYRRALDLRPAHAGAWSNLGLALQAENRLDEAIDAFRRALAVDPGFAQAHWNLALGAARASGIRRRMARIRLAPPRARVRGRGAPMAGTALGRRRCRRPHAARRLGAGAGRHAAVHPSRPAARRARSSRRRQHRTPLVRLLASAPGVAAVFGPGESLPPYDAHITLMELPRILGSRPSRSLRPCLISPRMPARRKEVAGIAGRTRGQAQGRHRMVGKPGQLARPPALDSARRAGTAVRAARHRMVLAAPERRRRGDLEGAAGAPRSIDSRCVRISTAWRRWSRSSISSSASIRASPISPARSRDRRGSCSPPAPTGAGTRLAADSPWYPTARLFRQPRLGDWTTVVLRVRDELAGAS